MEMLANIDSDHGHDSDDGIENSRRMCVAVCCSVLQCVAVCCGVVCGVFYILRGLSFPII